LPPPSLQICSATSSPNIVADLHRPPSLQICNVMLTFDICPFDGGPTSVHPTFVQRLLTFTRRPSTFVPTFVQFHPFDPFRPLMFVHKHPSTNVCPLSFIPVNTPYSSNRMLYYNFVASALYYYKILGHGTTPCSRMMRALPFNEN